MIREIEVNVSFLNNTLIKKDTGVVAGDYNSTKLVFNIEETLSEGEHLRFKLRNPNEEVVLLKELTEPEVILAGYDEEGNVYSLFEESGIYAFELVLYTDNSKLTSAPGWLTVNKRNVEVGQEGGGAYLPLLDEILLKLGESGKITDSEYNPESANPQSGKAVAKAIEDKATLELKDFGVRGISILSGEAIDGLYELFDTFTTDDEKIALTFLKKGGTFHTTTFKLLSTEPSELNQFKLLIGTKHKLSFYAHTNPNTQETIYEVDMVALKDVSNKQDKFAVVTETESEKILDFSKEFQATVKNSKGALSLGGKRINLCAENGTIDVCGAKLENLSAPEDETDAATKGYVDNLIQNSGGGVNQEQLEATVKTAVNEAVGDIDSVLEHILELQNELLGEAV